MRRKRTKFRFGTQNLITKILFISFSSSPPFSLRHVTPPAAYEWINKKKVRQDIYSRLHSNIWSCTTEALQLSNFLIQWDTFSLFIQQNLLYFCHRKEIIIIISLFLSYESRKNWNNENPHSSSQFQFNIEVPLSLFPSRQEQNLDKFSQIASESPKIRFTEKRFVLRSLKSKWDLYAIRKIKAIEVDRDTPKTLLSRWTWGNMNFGSVFLNMYKISVYFTYIPGI